MRVPPAATAGGGPIDSLEPVGKHRGQAHPWTPTAYSVAGMKRAYRRAKIRAATSSSGGTWYRGQWHSSQTLGALAAPESLPWRTRKRTRGLTAPKASKLSVLSWNTGGLNSSMYQEIMAWCDQQDSLDLVILQETHWGPTSDFVSGRWLMIHTAGSPDPAEHARFSGILVMINRQALKDPCVQEIIPGRLVLVRAMLRRTNLPIAVYGMYQHVWRSHLTTTVNHALRQAVWTGLDASLTSLPQRCELLLCGDFNATLRSEPGVVGPSILAQSSTFDEHLHSLLIKHALVALNTWHLRQPATYYSSTGSSQIDFVVTRRRMSGGPAKHAKPLRLFPVGANRLAGHYPILATVQTAPFFSKGSKPAPRPAQINMAELQSAVRDCSQTLQEMRQRIIRRSPTVPLYDLARTQTSINLIMLQEAAAAFPAKPGPDARVSADPRFRATASQTWQLYRSARKATVCTFRGIWDKWRLLAAFARASTQLRRQSKALKKEFLLGLIDTAEEAASKGDQRVLYSVVKRLTPRNQMHSSRMKDSRGRLLSSEEQLQAIVSYSNGVFAALADEEPPPVMSTDLSLEDAAVTCSLASLGIGKAVPKHVAPAACWKACASALGPVLGEAIRRHFKRGKSGQLQGDWKDTHVIWLPKPSKPPTTVANMRPIGLQCPSSKVLAMTLRQNLLVVLLPLLQQLPQFAYTMGRGTADALAKAHAHFTEVDDMLRGAAVNRFGQQAGIATPKCQGGMALSLDLSRAFDSVRRGLVYQALRDNGVDQATIEVVQHLHFQAKYHFTVGDRRDSTQTSTGIKQGCCIAPYLWSYFTTSFLLLLQARRDQAWIIRVLTLFADDCWGSWVIRSSSDFDRAREDLKLILETLESLQMNINYQKTAILLKLVGKDASALRHEAVFQKAGVTHLRIMVHGRECGIPVKEVPLCRTADA